MTSYSRYTSILAAALMIVGASATADTIRLSTPTQGASLHGGGVDMAIYYVEAGDRFDVVATYAPRARPEDVARLRLQMADGDYVSFGLPGQQGVIYRFSRLGALVEVSADPVRANLRKPMFEARSEN